ncbi:MAG: hypothetical protein JSW61_04035 [Candidatus Thorarchaeota archaeon]|nr:MAG: hypothetical protein JSW61_04035 [Candidatus Thorarchaeota archaeon]
MFKRTIIVLLLLFGWNAGSTAYDSKTTRELSVQDPSWSDDFEDGNFDGWTTYGAIGSGSQGSELPSNFTVTNGAIMAQGENWNLAFHNSSVVYGTWSIDVYPVDREHNEILLPFILESHRVYDWWKNGYIVQLVTGPYRYYTEPTITLVRVIQWPVDIVWLDEAPTGNMTGWQHIDITRDRSGHICVYLNGTLHLTTVDLLIRSSVLFGFCGESGQGIDNVTVTNDLITIDKAPPIWIPTELDNKTIELNQPLRYDLNASDPSGIDSWWLNDTVRFAIDNEGVVTNRTTLGIGEYGIHVWVNDTQGYTLDGSFTVIVAEPIPEDGGVAFPPELLIVGVAATVSIVAIVIVLRRYRRGL